MLGSVNFECTLCTWLDSANYIRGSRTHRLDVRQLAKSASRDKCSAPELNVAGAVDVKASRTVDDHECCESGSHIEELLHRGW